MVVHVLEPAHAGWGRTRTEAEARTRILREARLKEWTVEASAGDLVARYDIREGLAVDSILAGALQHRCDLIVMGTHGRGGYDRGQIGSIACGVLKQATCPVLTLSQIPVFLQSHPVSTTAGLQPQDAARGD